MPKKFSLQVITNYKTTNPSFITRSHPCTRRTSLYYSSNRTDATLSAAASQLRLGWAKDDPLRGTADCNIWRAAQLDMVLHVFLEDEDKPANTQRLTHRPRGHRML